MKLYLGFALCLNFLLPNLVRADDVPRDLTAAQWEATNCRYLSRTSEAHGQLGDTAPKLATCLFLQKAMILGRVLESHRGEDAGVIEFRTARENEFVSCPYQTKGANAVSPETGAYLWSWFHLKVGQTYRDKLTPEIEREIDRSVETSCPQS